MGKNEINTTAKERMLKKIRQALLQKRENPYPQFEDAPLYRKEDQPLSIWFAEQFSAVGGQFVYCEDEFQFMENLLVLVEREKYRKIYAWEKPMQEILDRYEFPFISNDQDFAGMDVGITGCEALVARDGSILISNANSSGRRLSSYAPVHIVYAKVSQLVPDIQDGLAFLHRKYGSSLPSLYSLITGPSRTADIEKTLVLGAHGPKEVFVFLVDD